MTARRAPEHHHNELVALMCEALKLHDSDADAVRRCLPAILVAAKSVIVSSKRNQKPEHRDRV